jgi:hypothetical protein
VVTGDPPEVTVAVRMIGLLYGTDVAEIASEIDVEEAAWAAGAINAVKRRQKIAAK